MASSYLVYVLASTLCVLYTTDALLLAYNYRFHRDNPAGAKLVLFAEMFKLVLAAFFFLSEPHRPRSAYQLLGDIGALHESKQQQQQQRKPSAQLATLWCFFRDNLVFAVPAACYFVTNK
jgi:hypothetical protein